MPERYRVICTHQATTEFKAVREQAEQQGLRNALLNVAEQIAD